MPVSGAFPAMQVQISLISSSGKENPGGRHDYRPHPVDDEVRHREAVKVDRGHGSRR